MERKTATERAYAIGYRHGLAWDLDGFESRADVEAEPNGWDTASIEAMGPRGFARELGVDVDNDAEMDAASEAYNRGAHAGALAPQEQRTGMPPMDHSHELSIHCADNGKALCGATTGPLSKTGTSGVDCPECIACLDAIAGEMVAREGR